VKNLVVLIAFFMLAKPAIPFLEYVINYDYIVKELCENKEKPALKCNGKCHLAKQLAKASEEEKSNSSDKKQNVKQEIETMFCVAFKAITFAKQPVFTNKNIDTNYQNLYASTAVQSIFHPPTFLF
jgi:5-methylthioribose kinase